MQTPIRYQRKPHIVPPCKADYLCIYEDEHMVVVNKPAGLLSQPGKHKFNQDSLLTRLKDSYATPYLVHRLDLDTSGVMVVALTKEAAAKLGRLFERREVEKHYIALVDGLVEQDHGVIELPLTVDWPKRPMQKVCFESGKPSKTEYKVLQRDIENNRSRVQLLPHTGRTHQLRLHMASIGHAIIGCDMYAGDRVCYAGERLFLHAERISVTHPSSQLTVSFEAPALF
jgi:tRNA pseudouridine32 synthase/23S rRNA pseudouridine746 synthase